MKNLNSDFSQRVVVRPKDYKWVDSPVPRVQRMMLDRMGEENGHATSIVKFEPNSEFHTHEHTGGEEFMVLDGIFSDEFHDYHKGTYVRNPIGTKHQPKIGDEGATILVKLCQFSSDDKSLKSIDTNKETWHPGSIDGLQVMPLHQFKGENVALVKWAPNTKFVPHKHFGGEEIFVLEGTFYDEHGVYPQGTWIRSPHMSDHNPYTKDDGTTILVKTGHLS